MDINDVRIVVTLTSFVLFIGIWGWGWSKRNRASFDEAAQLPFQDE